MASINAGTHTVRDIFRAAKFNFEENAAADYLGGAPDYRRVQIGGLGFDDLDDRIVVPVTADDLDITVDGESHTTLSVDLSEDQKKERAYSFETAADANDPNAK